VQKGKKRLQGVQFGASVNSKPEKKKQRHDKGRMLEREMGVTTKSDSQKFGGKRPADWGKERGTSVS